jgi:predicted DNA-binding protein (MmcQ/YjbR family)
MTLALCVNGILSHSQCIHPHAHALQQARAYKGGPSKWQKKDDDWKLCKGYCKNGAYCKVVKQKYWHDRLLEEDADRDLLAALEDADEFDERDLIEEPEERGLAEEDADIVERDLKSGKYDDKGKDDKGKGYKAYKYSKKQKYYQEKKKPVCERCASYHFTYIYSICTRCMSCSRLAMQLQHPQIQPNTHLACSQWCSIATPANSTEHLHSVLEGILTLSVHQDLAQAVCSAVYDCCATQLHRCVMCSIAH